MKQNNDTIKFWGVRGSIPSPGPSTIKYGGNTACVQITLGNTHLIFDAGTGIRELGLHLATQSPITTHLLLSHYHWDHIQGFPFFIPAFMPESSITIYGKKPVHSSIKQVLENQMTSPVFPVSMTIMKATLTYKTITQDTSFNINDINILTKPLNHVSESLGYRITYKNKVIAYISDTEHFSDKLDDNVLELAKDTDVIIYDAMYTDAEYQDPKSPKIGWGHSTWQEAIKIAKASKTKKLVIFHHEPNHNDKIMDEIAKQTKQAYPQSIIAREGLTLTI